MQVKRKANTRDRVRAYVRESLLYIQSPPLPVKEQCEGERRGGGNRHARTTTAFYCASSSSNNYNSVFCYQYQPPH